LSSYHYSSHRVSSLDPVIEEGEDGATAASANPNDNQAFNYEEEGEEKQREAEVGAEALSFYELNENAFAPDSGSALKWAIESIAESGESSSSSDP
jgi:hypothetical protein